MITDIKMPFMDGLKLISKLKKTGLNFEAIILSGYSEFEYAQRGIDLGVNKYILKPVEQEDLMAAVSQSIARYEDTVLLDEEEISKRRKQKRSVAHDQNHNNRDVIDSVKEYLSIHYTENITLSVLSERFFLNPYYLSQLFRKKTGQTYIQFLTQIRIEKAKVLLAKKDKNISEVCHSVGYENVKHFSRTFEKHAGVKPSQYKQQSE